MKWESVSDQMFVHVKLDGKAISVTPALPFPVANMDLVSITHLNVFVKQMKVDNHCGREHSVTGPHVPIATPLMDFALNPSSANAMAAGLVMTVRHVWLYPAACMASARSTGPTLVSVIRVGKVICATSQSVQKGVKRSMDSVTSQTPASARQVGKELIARTVSNTGPALLVQVHLALSRTSASVIVQWQLTVPSATGNLSMGPS